MAIRALWMPTGRGRLNTSVSHAEDLWVAMGNPNLWMRTIGNLLRFTPVNTFTLMARCNT